MARPRGEISNLLLQCLREGGGTSREIAQRTVMSYGAAVRGLDNMVTRGEVVKVGSVRRPGVKRPVPVYELAPVALESAEPTGIHLQRLLSSWRPDLDNLRA